MEKLPESLVCCYQLSRAVKPECALCIFRSFILRRRSPESYVRRAARPYMQLARFALRCANSDHQNLFTDRGGLQMDPVSRPWVSSDIDTGERTRAFIRQAYMWMFGGLLLTAGAAAWVVLSKPM